MGTWSHEPFGNDTALDWVYGLQETPDISYVEHAIDRVIENETGYIESFESEEAISAIAIVHAIHTGRNVSDGESYPEAVIEWTSQYKDQLQPDLILKAKAAIDRILSEGSELLELWQENEEDNMRWKLQLDRMKRELA